jgi:hypothetical protein
VVRGGGVIYPPLDLFLIFVGRVGGLVLGYWQDGRPAKSGSYAKANCSALGDDCCTFGYVANDATFVHFGDWADGSFDWDCDGGDSGAVDFGDSFGAGDFGNRVCVGAQVVGEV